MRGGRFSHSITAAKGYNSDDGGGADQVVFFNKFSLAGTGRTNRHPRGDTSEAAFDFSGCSEGDQGCGETLHEKGKLSTSERGCDVVPTTNVAKSPNIATTTCGTAHAVPRCGGSDRVHEKRDVHVLSRQGRTVANLGYHVDPNCHVLTTNVAMSTTAAMATCGNLNEVIGCNGNDRVHEKSKLSVPLRQDHLVGVHSSGAAMSNGVGQQHKDTCMGQMSSMGGLLMNDPMQMGVCDSVKDMGSGDLTGDNTKGLGSAVAGHVRTWKKQALVKKGLGGSEGVGIGSLKKRKADESEQGKHMTIGGKKARRYFSPC